MQKEHNNTRVMISIDYRLGAFGFLSGPPFSESGTPNAGLWDQRMALQWVQDNIHPFGEYPNNVKVSRSPASAGSIIYLLTAFGRAAKATFQHASVESPAVWVTSNAAREDQTFSTVLRLAKANSLLEGRDASSGQLSTLR